MDREHLGDPGVDGSRMPEWRMVKKSVQVETDVKKTTRETKEQMGR